MDEFNNETEIIVRYAETDQMGIAHHSNYPVWFEIGRTDFLKKIGYSYSTIEKKGVLMPLTDMNCRFIKPARYEDIIIVQTSISRIGHVKVGFGYAVYNKKDGILIAAGETNHGCTDRNLNPVIIERALPELFMALQEHYKNN